MIEFSGTNRSYCYVRYTTQEEAREAIRKLNNYHVRPGYPLAVTRWGWGGGKRGDMRNIYLHRSQSTPNH